MIQLSTVTLEILRKNDWQESRRIDIHKYETFFQETGQVPSPLILDFLQQFGDMKISFPSKYYSNRLHWVLIDPIEESQSPELLANYSNNWIKKPLCVVGSLDDNSFIAMTPEGEVYSFFDNWVVKFGNTPYEALNNLCDKQETISRVLPPGK
jgi:hypothetical protein